MMVYFLNYIKLVLVEKYNDCRLRVRCKHFLTYTILIIKGVHQGNVLSQLLFNIFIIEIGDAFCEIDIPVLHNSKISHLLYVEYLLLSSTTSEGLQHNIYKTQEFCKPWGLSISIGKTKAMIFSKKMVEPTTTGFSL